MSTNSFDREKIFLARNSSMLFSQSWKNLFRRRMYHFRSNRLVTAVKWLYTCITSTLVIITKYTLPVLSVNTVDSATLSAYMCKDSILYLKSIYNCSVCNVAMGINSWWCIIVIITTFPYLVQTKINWTWFCDCIDVCHHPSSDIFASSNKMSTMSLLRCWILFLKVRYVLLTNYIAT